MANKYHQYGLSMVELLVSLAISGFLILGVTQIYVDNKRSYLFQQGQAEVNDASRFLMYVLDNEFHKIGYRRRPDLSYENIFKAIDDFSIGEIIKVDSESKLRFRYQPHSDSDYACDGTTMALEDVNNIYKGWSITPRVITVEFDKANSVLKCNGQEVVLGVLEFKLLYAVPVNNTNSREGLKYVGIADVDSTSKIKGIRYQALVASSMKNLSDTDDSKAANAFYANNSEKPKDKAIYQLLTKTVMLRNTTSW